MRLNETERTAIMHNARKHFGADASVRLFGSRVDQSKKGGDIDLLIHADQGKMNLKKKLLFLVDLKKEIGQRKIDVVFDRNENKNSFFIQSIKKKSIAL